MPLRNEERYLPAALESLFRQTFRSWELIAVDDGSTDATPAILAEAERRDARVRIVRSSEKGLVNALNAGLSCCRAEFVARMDGDDICHPRRLELQVAHLDSHPEVSLVACGFRHFPRNSLKPGMIAYETWQNGLDSHERIMSDLFVESPFVHPSIICRKVLMEQMNGYRDWGWAEDYDLWLRMARFGARFARLPETLFFWRDHPERATRTMEEYSATSFRNCKLDNLKNGFLQGVNTVVIAGAGLEGRAWQRMLAVHGIAVSAWIDVDPRKIGKNLHGAEVLSTASIAAVQDRIIVAIGVRGARDQFREMVTPFRLQEGIDFVCVC
jgi:glycosyltransferase involved in cell wall biosynthesis